MAVKTIKKQKREIWSRHIEERAWSGSTQAAYSRHHKLSTKSFTFWKRRFRQNSAVSIMPVQVKPETSDDSRKLTLQHLDHDEFEASTPQWD